MNSSYCKHERIWLKDCPDIDEKWVQQIIEEDPTQLKLGDVFVKDRERIHRGAGRLDLLLQEVDSKRRYELELQLGPTDESHIIRTIEYWDIERKRYPQYEHCAVIVAEDITSRFLNVISLFNGSIPLIAIQMQLLKIGQHTTLVFTTVLNEMTRGPVDEDEDAQSAPADRAYWESKGSKATVALADDLLKLLKEIDSSLELKYNKGYIGLSRGRQACNFVSMEPRKTHMNLKIKLPRSQYFDDKIATGELELLEHAGAYKIRLTKEEIAKKAPLLVELMNAAYNERLKLE